MNSIQALDILEEYEEWWTANSEFLSPQSKYLADQLYQSLQATNVKSVLKKHSP